MVVAADGHDPEVERIAAEAGVDLTVLVQPAGSYAARNQALTYLGDWPQVVLFTDADCLPQAGWIEAHIEALAHADLSGGAVRVTLTSEASPSEFVDRCRHLQQESYVTRQGYAATANLGVTREVARLRFDASLHSGGDREFCRRATALGYTLAYTPRALVIHPARRTRRELLRKIFRLSRAIRHRPQAWADRRLPPIRLPHRIVLRARRESVSRGVPWDLEVAALNLVADLLIFSSVLCAKSACRLHGSTNTSQALP